MFSRASSSDEADISDSSVNSKAIFRVSVCLRRYFTDVRARAYMQASRRRRVRWLQQRIRKVFGLRGAFCLRAAGHLLPPGEPLRLLRADDCVEVIPLQETETGNQNQQHAIKQFKGTESHTEEITVTRVSTFAADDSTADCTVDCTADCTRRSDQTEPRGTDITDGAAGSPAAADRSPGAADCAADGSGCDEWRLRALKRRALEMLDVSCGRAATDDGSPAPRRRRRVRRRQRRAPSPAPSPPPTAAPAPSPPPEAAPAPSPPAAATPARDGDVARNEDAYVRKPRMVHSLDVEYMC